MGKEVHIKENLYTGDPVLSESLMKAVTISRSRGETASPYPTGQYGSNPSNPSQNQPAQPTNGAGKIPSNSNGQDVNYTAANISQRYDAVKDDPIAQAKLDYEIATAIWKGQINVSGEDRIRLLGENYQRIQANWINPIARGEISAFAAPGTPDYENIINRVNSGEVSMPDPSNLNGKTEINRDYNGDGKVDKADVHEFLQEYTNNIGNDQGLDPSKYDINGDGKVAMDDISQMLSDINSNPNTTQQDGKTELSRDVDGDGKFTHKDVAKLTQEIVNTPSGEEPDVSKYDFNGDGHVNVSDAVQLLDEWTEKAKAFVFNEKTTTDPSTLHFRQYESSAKYTESSVNTPEINTLERNIQQAAAVWLDNKDAVSSEDVEKRDMAEQILNKLVLDRQTALTTYKEENQDGIMVSEEFFAPDGLRGLLEMRLGQADKNSQEYTEILDQYESVVKNERNKMLIGALTTGGTTAYKELSAQFEKEDQARLTKDEKTSVREIIEVVSSTPESDEPSIV